MWWGGWLNWTNWKVNFLFISILGISISSHQIRCDPNLLNSVDSSSTAALAFRVNEFIAKHSYFRSMVVTQLAEHLLPTPVVCSSNPVIGKIDIEHCLLSTVLKRRKKKKRPGKAIFKISRNYYEPISVSSFKAKTGLNLSLISKGTCEAKGK